MGRIIAGASPIVVPFSQTSLAIMPSQVALLDESLAEMGAKGFGKWFEESVVVNSEGASEPERIIEAGGRLCYQSWSNPSNKTNEEYIGNIIQHQHYSVLEHASAGFVIITDRAITHELVRHRHQSPSQESTRYVDKTETSHMVPEVFLETEEDRATVEDYLNATKKMYEWAKEKADTRYAFIADRTLRRKMARQAARMFLPHTTVAPIMITGNYRAWFEAMVKRGNYHADIGIRRVYMQVLFHLQRQAPSVFQYFTFKTWQDGTDYIELDLRDRNG